MKKRYLILALVTVAATIAAACGGGSSSGDRGADSPPATNAVNASAEPDPASTVRFAQSATPGQWDPHMTPSPYIELIYQTQVYDRLVFLEVDNSLSPMLAESWTFSPDGLALTMKLRPGVTFQDGSAFDAGVAVANLKRALGPESTVKGQLASVSDVVATDASTIQITLSRPDSTLLFALANQPGMMVSPAGLTDPNLKTKPQGSGAFSLDSVGADIATFTRNPRYWDTTVVLPARKEIVSIADDSTKLNALKSGAVDIALIRSTQSPEAKELQADGAFSLYAYDSVTFYGIHMNNKIPPLDNVNVRRAINMAIDRQGLNEGVYNGECSTMSQAFPEGIVGNDPSLGEGFEYDPVEAKRIIEAEGASGAKIQIIQQANEPHATNAQIVQAQLAEIGIEVELLRTETNLVRTTWRKGETAGAITAMLSSFPDPGGLLQAYTGADNPGDKDPELTRLAAEAASLPIGSSEREKAYQEVGRYLFENPVHAILCSPPTLYLADNALLGGDDMPYSTLGAFPDTRFLVKAKG